MTTRNFRLVNTAPATFVGLCLMFSVSFGAASTISIDATDGSAAIAGGTAAGTITNFTVPNNASRALVVAIGGEVSTTVSSVTFGAQSFTEADTAIFAGNTMSSIWYLLNPAATTDDITVTRSSSSGNGWAFGAVSLSNVSQVAPVSATFDTGNASNPSVSLVTTDDNSVIVEALGRNETGTTTPNSGQSIFFSSLSLAGGAGFLASTDEIPLAGLTSQSWTLTGSNRTPLVAAAFAPLPPIIPEPSSIMLLGLGIVALAGHSRRRTRNIGLAG